MQLLKALALLILAGVTVVAITFALGRLPGWISRKKKKSCCD
ncbi:MAG: hypothetical protein ACXVBE_01980 [Bdellovibrionota bacterium]